ncbi:conserved hypothetical protein [Trichinella spiralis]|uniref:hypothetical protein n=1 Tax=Trichinella spiralis TaxID=6334 RepID=UPI0001EFE491|nr:conserved hypothetical protein [Trichinella spiralis]
MVMSELTGSSDLISRMQSTCYHTLVWQHIVFVPVVEFVQRAWVSKRNNFYIPQRQPEDLTDIFTHQDTGQFYIAGTICLRYFTLPRQSWRFSPYDHYNVKLKLNMQMPEISATLSQSMSPFLSGSEPQLVLNY